MRRTLSLGGREASFFDSLSLSYDFFGLRAMQARSLRIEREEAGGWDLKVCGLHSLGRHVELRRPDDAVEDEAAQVIVTPVFVEMWHHDAEAASGGDGWENVPITASVR